MKVNRLVAFLLIVVVMLALVGVTSPALLDRIKLGLDLKGGFEILYVATPIDEGGVLTKDSLHETAKSLEKRVDKEGVAEPEITTEGKDRIRVRLAGVTDEQKVRDKLKEPSALTFKGPDGKVEMDGRDFVPGGAKVQYQNGTQPIVEIKLKDAAKFKDITTRLLGQTLSIYMDDERISSPSVNQVIDSNTAVITGQFDYQEAKDLAEKINLGALPLKLTEKYTQSVGASLGQLSLEDTVRAGVIAAIIILAFMLFFYRLPGIVASITLITFTWLLLLVFYLMNVTLTLPGIAAFVLAIGMAVDANIITYERIKEEIRSGKSLLSALKSGSKHSFRTIMDANITNFIAGVVLYYVGNGAIRGFALTTLLSIALSILTNVFFSRFLIYLLIRSNVWKKPSYYGVKEAEIRDL
ncbi:protein translocase subunit SecD [Paenibacillus cymbidii]|uniref:protein translocase subunit SecD n=1 Tax=Paenibacillus cymbidii TaxID=1639034 RepID=UPI0010821D2C|nr:protein translocase subunit SecD [Paenibacillus cymbidii]